VASGGQPLRDGGLPDPLWPVLPEPAWTPPPPPPAPLLAPADAALVTSGAAGTDAAAARAALTADDQVVVRRGDSLWRIAERHLGADATDAEVAVEWPRWWHANRRVVGADPDLLLPGTRLTPPDP
jgi:nucleoid-associated protein YgaU